MLSLNSNLGSMVAQRSLAHTQTTLASTLERLSTGLRVNSAKDDAAGLAISERMTTAVRGLSVAEQNAAQAGSSLQVADGVLSEASGMVQRIRELALSALNGTHTDSDRELLDLEVQQLVDGLREIEETRYNGRAVFDDRARSRLAQIGSARGEALAYGVADKDIGRAASAGREIQLSEESMANPTASYALQVERLSPGQALGQGITYDFGWFPAGAVASDPGYATYDHQAEIQSYLDSINAQTGVTGLGARRLDEITVHSTFTADAIYDRYFELNGVRIDVPAGSDRDAFISIINAASMETGVTAEPAEFLGKVTFLSQRDEMKFTEADPPIDHDFGDLATPDVDDFLAYQDFIDANGGPPQQILGVHGDISLGGEETKRYFRGFQLTTRNFEDRYEVQPGAPGSVAPHALQGVDINVRTEKNAREALRYADVALGLIAEARTEVGAQLAALENASVQARVQREGVTAARSRIQDADFAVETANLTRAQILQQAGLASLAQANASPQTVLSLLG